MAEKPSVSVRLTTAWTFDASTDAAAPPAAEVLRALSIPAKEVDCSICWGSVAQKHVVLFDPCSHPVCRPCSISLLRSSLLPGARGVLCPVCVDTGGWLPAEHPAAVASALRRRSSAGTSSPATEPPPVLLVRAPSAPRPIFGELTEQLVRRLHAWSVRPSTVLPAGIRPLTVDDVSRFVRAQIEAAVADGILPPGARGTAAGDRRRAAPAAPGAAAKACKPGGPAGGAGAAAVDSGAAPGSERIIRCWNPACAAMLIAAVTDRPESEACPHCKEWLCVACGGQWAAHDGKSCSDAAKATTAELTASLLLNKRQGATFMLCPGCGEAVSKLHGHGCHHMDGECCRAKGKDPSPWCYGCGGFIVDGQCDMDCAQYCDENCSCPPCQECFSVWAVYGAVGGCNMCAGDCRLCLRLEAGELLFDPSRDGEQLAFWATYFDANDEDAAAMAAATQEAGPVDAATAKALGHYGSWRHMGEAFTYFCSVPGLRNAGPLCDHYLVAVDAAAKQAEALHSVSLRASESSASMGGAGAAASASSDPAPAAAVSKSAISATAATAVGIIEQPHWSCCGSTSRAGRCVRSGPSAALEAAQLRETV